VSPTSLDFGVVGAGSTSAPQTLTLTNPTAAGLTGVTVAVTAPYSRLAGTAGGTCGTTLAAGGNCTIILVFSPASTATPYPAGTATITANVPVLGSPVALTGEVVVPTYTASIAPTFLTFGSQVDGTTSAAQTLTVTNTGTATLTLGTFTFSAGFAQATGGSCTATLAVGASCTLHVVFTPPATAPVGAYNGTLTVAYADTPNPAATVTPTQVPLSGTTAAQIVSATLTPASWTVSHARNCPGTGILGTVACLADPVQAFTLTNTGNVTLTGIGQGALGGTASNDANYTIVRALSTCGPNGNGQVLGPHTTLAPGSTCVVTVQFKPLTSQAAGAKPATVTVTDAAGTQTSTLSGTAN
jgi:hypothetical protein